MLRLRWLLCDCNHSNATNSGYGLSLTLASSHEAKKPMSRSFTPQTPMNSSTSKFQKGESKVTTIVEQKLILFIAHLLQVPEISGSQILILQAELRDY